MGAVVVWLLVAVVVLAARLWLVARRLRQATRLVAQLGARLAERAHELEQKTLAAELLRMRLLRQAVQQDKPHVDPRFPLR